MHTIACIPGLLCTGAIFDGLAAALPADTPLQINELSDSDAFNTLAARIAEEIPPACVLIGMSMGSYLALMVQRLRPEAVKGLVLIGTNARADTPEAAENRKKTVNRARKHGMQVLAEGLSDLMLGAAQRDNPALRGKIADMAIAPGSEVFARQQSALASRADQSDALGAIHCPVLVITGSEDVITPPAAGAELARMVPQGAQVILEGVGHLPLLEAPQQVAALVARFLTDLPTSESLPE